MDEKKIQRIFSQEQQRDMTPLFPLFSSRKVLPAKSLRESSDTYFRSILSGLKKKGLLRELLMRLVPEIRMTANTFRGGFGARIFFLHIPKCGGKSTHYAISSRYTMIEKLRGFRGLDISSTYVAAKALNPTVNPFSADDYEILKLRESLLLYFMGQKQTLYISDHFAFSESAYKAFHSEFTFITMLRNPVKRWISYYFYGRHHGNIKLELADFLKTDYARTQGYEIVKFIGGPIKDGNYASREAIERAKENIGKFHIVGFLEHLDDFAEKFRARFGINLRLSRFNRSPVAVSSQKLQISEEITKAIEELCKPDMDVYQHALALCLRETMTK
jgi:hypothetical protein